MGDTAAFIIEVTNELEDHELNSFAERLRNAIIDRDTRAIRELIESTMRDRFNEATG